MICVWFSSGIVTEDWAHWSEWSTIHTRVSLQIEGRRHSAVSGRSNRGPKLEKKRSRLSIIILSVLLEISEEDQMV